MAKILVEQFIKELDSEAPATRKCLERIPESLFSWKPHQKSMAMGYLAVIVAEVPKWIVTMALEPELDFMKWEKFEPKTTAELIAYFDKALVASKEALSKVSDEDLDADFHLKANGQILYTAPKVVNISSAIRHWVHHRGQLTVFMRLKDIPVPAIYGPSSDEKAF